VVKIQLTSTNFTSGKLPSKFTDTTLNSDCFP
jgi:hypothetical protein